MPFEKFDITPFENYQAELVDLIGHLRQFSSGEILEFDDIGDVFEALNKSIECANVYFVSNAKYCRSRLQSQERPYKATKRHINQQSNLDYIIRKNQTNGAADQQKDCIVLDRLSSADELVPDCVQDSAAVKRQLTSLIQYFAEDFGNLSQTIEYLDSVKDDLAKVISEFKGQFAKVNSISESMNDLVTILTSFFQMSNDQDF